MKDGSTKAPSARQIELGKKPREQTGKAYAPGTKTNANANQTDTSLTDMSLPVPEESRNQRRKRQRAEKDVEERAANGGMTKREMAAMHTFMCKMSDMEPPDANEIGSANQAKEMQNDYTTGLAALDPESEVRLQKSRPAAKLRHVYYEKVQLKPRRSNTHLALISDTVECFDLRIFLY